MKNLNQLRDRIFEINKANGWHEGQRTFGELISLVHSEVSEALEDYRMPDTQINEVWFEYNDEDGKFTTSSPDFCGALGKPCGIPSELADIVIRILDICGLYQWDIESEIRMPKLLPSPKSFAEELTNIHLYLSFAYYYEHVEDDAEDALDHLSVAIILVHRICEANDINLESIIHQKLEYNKTRGYRHGGKVI